MKTKAASKKDTQDDDHHGGNFWYLFVGLLLTVSSVPWMNVLPQVSRQSIVILFNLFILVGVWSLAGSRRVFQFGMVLVFAVCVTAGLSIFLGPSTTLEAIGLVLVLIFASLSSWIAARDVFVLQRADLNALVGAFCVYLLLGLIWAMVYRLLHLYGWATFSGSVAGEHEHIFPDLIYFSFVTLASLGYGDITPVGALVRTVAYLEAVFGQFYLAVLVASLVGAYTARRSQE